MGKIFVKFNKILYEQINSQKNKNDKMIISSVPPSSPTSVPISSPQLETKISVPFSFSLYHCLVGYLISTLLCFIYLLFAKKSMSFLSKFLSSFIAPFAILAILIRNTFFFINSLFWQALITIFVYIIFPIFEIVYFYFFIPICNVIEYIYRHTKIIWIFIAKTGKSIFNFIGKIISFIFEKIIFGTLKLIFNYIIKPIVLFIFDYILNPLFERIIIPLFKFISNMPAFQAIVYYITEAFKFVYDLIVKMMTAIAKIINSVINAAREIIKETYEQVILPFVQLIKRIFGE